MIANSSQRNRRALLLLGIGTIVYVLFTMVLFPMYDRMRGAAAEAAESEELLQKYRRELAQRDRYATIETDARTRLQELQTHFFSNDAVGSADLQRIVEDAAKQTGVDLSQRTASQTKKLDDLVSEISMTATFEATVNQLVTFLSQLRNSSKILTVRAAQVDPTQIAYDTPKQGELKKTVRVGLTIVGKALTATPDKVN